MYLHVFLSIKVIYSHAPRIANSLPASHFTFHCFLSPLLSCSHQCSSISCRYFRLAFFIWRSNSVWIMCACAVHVLYFILVQLPTLDRRQFGIALIYKLSPMLLVLFSVVIAATTAARCHHFMNQTKPIKNNSIRFDSMPFVRVVVFASYKLYELFVCMHARFGFFCLCCRFRLIYAYCIVALKFYAINKFPKQYTTNTHEVDTTPHDPLAL